MYTSNLFELGEIFLPIRVDVYYFSCFLGGNLFKGVVYFNFFEDLCDIVVLIGVSFVDLY